MPTIHVLPDNLVHKIAAGEVVERPASVVKELMENALDAGATEIEVHLQRGGLTEIRVVDNGHGMHADEVLLAIAPHATSKVATEEDLTRIQTYGFRGEALCAISSVSRFSLLTRAKEEGAGTRIELEGGEPRSTQVGMPPGTDVSVGDLFFQTPGRRKFLKSATTEFGHIQETFVRFALCRCGIGFSLTHNGKLIHRLARESDLHSRAKELLSWRGQWLDLPFPENLPGIHGVISSPHEPYGNRERFFTYVNHRFIRDRTFHHAISTAYREVAKAGSFPVVILHLEMDPGEVDVNVHPTKAEVRFLHAGAIHDLIYKTIRKALAAAGGPGRMIDSGVPVAPVLPYAERQHFTSTLAAMTLAEKAPAALGRWFEPTGNFSQLRVVGQWMNTYLICERTGAAQKAELCLIDQHAAHERIGYERLKRAYKEGNLRGQVALIPQTFEVSPLEYALLMEAADTLDTFGFDVEGFGGNTVLVRQVPALLQKAPVQSLLRSLLTDLEKFGKSSAIDDLLDRMLMTLSCHTMVRANHRLEHKEIEELLRQLDEVDFSQKCPHGRPIMISFSRSEIERRFGRT